MMTSHSEEAEPEVDWAAIIASVESGEEPAGWIHISPVIVAIFSIRDCEEQLERSAAEPLRLAQAAKSAHLAVQAALTAALSGSMGIGAHPEKLRIKYLEYLQGASGERPESNRVMAFNDLLNQALSSPLEWSGKPLSIADEQLALLDRLGDLRDGIEHTKQVHWGIEVAYILEVLPVAAHLTAELLEVVFHHLEPGELDSVKSTAAHIEQLCEGREQEIKGE
jgi:hypothetical protein